MATIYSHGYQQSKNGGVDFVRTLIEKGALLVDSRFKPYAKQQDWTRASLVEAFGDKYVWARGCGNENYKNGGPIKLHDPEKEYSWLVPLLKEGRDVVVICCCANHDKCHRKVVIEELAKRSGAQIVKTAEISPAGKPKPKPPTQLFLF